MRVIFLGKDKPVVRDGLQRVLDAGHEVAVVCTRPGGVSALARTRNIPVMDAEALYHSIAAGRLAGIDLVLSFIYGARILPPLIALPRLGCINFHPAPLPEYRGWGVYNFGIYNQEREWRVSAHFVDESFDTGDLVADHRFPIDPEKETVQSLTQKCAPHLLDLLDQVIDLAGKSSLPRFKQGEGRYYSREMAEQLRQVRPEDSPEIVRRKIRAFWHPPHPGATIKLHGHPYTLINEEILKDLS